MSTLEPTERRGRGRVRSDESRRAILAAALELVQEVGYAQLTIEGIATKAGVGKQTIYRWWASRAAVVLEALEDAAATDVPMPDTGSLRTDLQAWLRSTFKAGRREPYISVLPALMAAAQLDPSFGESFRTDFLAGRREALRVLLHRARDRGDQAPAVDDDMLIDIVFGVLWYRLLSAHALVDAELADELTELLSASDGKRQRSR